MSVPEDIGKAIVTATIASAEGTDLFYGLAPDTPDFVVVVGTPAGGQPRDKTATIMYPNVQVYIRHTNYSTGYSKGESIITLFDQTGTTTRNGRVYYYMTAMQSVPNYLGIDDSGRHEFTVNFEVVCNV